MDGPHVSYVGTTRDGKPVQVLLHGRVNRCTVAEAEQLCDQLTDVIGEAHRRGFAAAGAKVRSNVRHLYGGPRS